MKYSIASLILVAAFGTNSKAQTITIKERLDGGEYIVLIDNQEQRTLTSAHADDIKRRLGELSILQEALPVCQKLNADYKARVDTAVVQGEGWKRLFDSEHQLRLDMQAFIKRPSRFNSFMDKWYVKLPVTFVPPILTVLK